MRTEDHQVLLVGPPERLTTDGRAALRRWKPQLLALVEYCDTHETMQ